MRAKTTIRFDRNGNVAKITSNAGFTRNNKAAFHLHCNDVQPTFGVKLRRFFRRLRLTIRHYAEAAHYNRHHPAALMPYIGMEDRL